VSDDYLSNKEEHSSIMKKELLLEEGKLPYGFMYPDSIKKAIKYDLVNLCPWTILERSFAEFMLDGIQSRYPTKKYIPFASRQDNDDFACFVGGQGEEVQIIHDFASPGWEAYGNKYQDFWEWFKVAIDDMIEGDYD